jgi:hypothetical protein
MPIPFYHPKPRPPAAFEGVPLPQRTANVVSRTIFQWITPILQVGYSRPLELEGGRAPASIPTSTREGVLADVGNRPLVVDGRSAMPDGES